MRPDQSTPGTSAAAADRPAAVEEFERLVYETMFADDPAPLGWMGVPTAKLPLDLWTFQQILFDTRPDLIIESGVFRGGTTLFLAHMLDLIGNGRVIGIDPDLTAVDERVREHPRVSLIAGSSVEPRVIARLKSAARGRRVMVDLDADHRAVHVSEELRDLAPLVTPGCYLIVEDTNLNGNPVVADYGRGPSEALAEWLQGNPPFDVDSSREHPLLATFNPGGYLLRRAAPVATEPEAPPVPDSEEAPSGASGGTTATNEAPAGDELRQIAELVERGSKVLELGCAAGELSRLLTERDCEVVGIEPDEDLAAQAEEVCERVLVGELTELPKELGEERFDVVLAIGSLERVAEPERLLAAARERLEPGGCVIAAVTNVTHASTRLALLGGEFPGAGGAAGRSSFFTLETLEESFREAGLGLGRLVRQLSAEPLEERGPAWAGEAVQRALLEDPDASTRRFVVVGYPLPSGELELVATRMAELARRAEDAEREAAALRGRVRNAEETEQDLAEARVLLEESSTESESLRRSVLASSQRVHELDRALAELAKLAERRAARIGQLEGGQDELEQWKAVAEERRRSLVQTQVRLDRLQSAPPIRAYRGLQRIPPLSWIAKRRAKGYWSDVGAAGADEPDRSGE